MKQVISISDNSIRKRTAAQNCGWGISYWLNWLNILIYFYVVFFLFQSNPVTLYNYFVNGTTQCQLNGTGFYDLGLHRWLFLFFAMNILDLRFSRNNGRKFYGRYTIFSNIIALVVNLLILAVTLISYLQGCNKDGNGANLNLCTNRYICGVSSYYSNPDNNCVSKNPYGPVLPPYEIGFWNFDTWFIQWLILLIVFIISHFIKTIGNAKLTEATEIIRKGVQYTQDNLNELKASNKPLDFFDESDEKPKIVQEKNIVDVIDIFTIYKQTHVIFYFPVEIIDYLLGIFIIIWAGWFLPNVKLSTYWFAPVTTPMPHVTMVTKGLFDVGLNYWFYASFMIIALCWIINADIANLFHNRRAIWSSLIAVVYLVFIMIFMFLYYYIQCNQIGQSQNICNDRKRFCATISSSLVGYWTMQQNGCLNSYTCPITYEPNELQIDTDYWALIVFTFYAFFTFVMTGIYSSVIEPRRSKYVKNKKQSDVTDVEAFESDIISRLDTRTPQEIQQLQQVQQFQQVPIQNYPYNPGYVQEPFYNQYNQ